MLIGKAVYALQFHDDLFKKSGFQHICNLEGGANYGLRQIRFRSVCISVRLMSSLYTSKI